MADYEECLEIKFNERYESLRNLMEVKLETLYDSVEKALEKVYIFEFKYLFLFKILSDELIQIMKKDPISQKFV